MNHANFEALNRAACNYSRQGPQIKGKNNARKVIWDRETNELGTSFSGGCSSD